MGDALHVSSQELPAASPVLPSREPAEVAPAQIPAHPLCTMVAWRGGDTQPAQGLLGEAQPGVADLFSTGLVG